MPGRLWTRNESESSRRILQIRRVENGGRYRLVVEEGIRRIESKRCARLREDGLENTSVIDSVSRPNRAFTGFTKDSAQPAAFEVGAVSKTYSWFNVVLIVAEAVFDLSIGFARRINILVSKA